MGKNTSISLGDHYEEFARRKVASGEFGSLSEVIRHAMRRYMEREAKREALDHALKEGLESGPSEDFAFDDFLREMRANYKAS